MGLNMRGVPVPYITPNLRPAFAEPVEDIADIIRAFGESGRAGLLNYVISSLISRLYGDPRYADINEAIGVLECAKLELYRMVAEPYEDKKIEENGRVYRMSGEG